MDGGRMTTTEERPQTREHRAASAGATPPPVKPRRSLARGLLGWCIWLVVLGGLGTAAWWYWPLLPQREAAEQKGGGRFGANQAMPVGLAPVQLGDLPVSLNALGTVTPFATVTVRTQVSGRLTKVGFQEGQAVNEGDFLIEIDPRPFQAALDQMEGQLARDTALLRNAEVDLARYKTLVQQDSIARQQRDNQEYLVRQYQGTVRSDQAMVDNAKINLGFTRILAPMAGRVGLRLVDPG